jgi:L-aspartate oxidase
VFAKNVLLAAGGAGQLFAVTTNPLIATGDGMAMAIRAGVACADLEFVQFHPTALHHPQMPRPLLSEALRGHGALLRNTKGERFVDELLPRDEVSRAMTAQMLTHDVDHCFLDATGLDDFARRFPTIAADLRSVGLDPESDWLPIAPAAHYCCGGILTDLSGATSLPGLWAAGEVTSAGVHGANRLASNSLLDGMVYGTRVVEAVDDGVRGAVATGAMRSLMSVNPEPEIAGLLLTSSELAGGKKLNLGVAELRSLLQHTMTTEAGVLRSRESLERALQTLTDIAASIPVEDATRTHELTNLVTVAHGLLDSALARTESRGAHTRTDFPDTMDSMRLRMVLT